MKDYEIFKICGPRTSSLKQVLFLEITPRFVFIFLLFFFPSSSFACLFILLLQKNYSNPWQIKLRTYKKEDYKPLCKPFIAVCVGTGELSSA